MNYKSKHVKRALTMLFLFIACAVQSFAQVTVTGTVTDGENGEAIPGVNVVIDGTTNGTVTDVDGKYSITVPDVNSTLQFSYIGYLVQKISVQGATVIDVTLVPDIHSLDEVVVVGYGVMKRSDLTGAVSSISQDDMAANKGANALEVMQGKVAGLDITQSSGESGGDINITLRGTRSFVADNDPLILVDGIEYGTTLDINPSDIESVEILKDASSTAIYGTRGANGVIMITTKKGKQGKSNVYFNMYTSYNMPSFIPSVMNGKEYAQKRFQTKIAEDELDLWGDMDVELTEAEDANEEDYITGIEWDADEVANAGFENPWDVFGSVAFEDAFADYDNPYTYISDNPTYLEWISQDRNNDYLDMVLSNSITDNYEFGYTGGDENTSVNFSLGMMNDRGLLENDKLRRYNVKLGVDQQITSKIKMGANILYTNKSHNKRDAGVFNQSLKTGSIGELYDDEGFLILAPPCIYYTENQANPLLDEQEGVYKRVIETNRVFGSAYFRWDIIEGLNFSSTFGMNIKNEEDGRYEGPTSLAQNSNKIAATYIAHNNDWGYTWNNVLSYQKSFGLNSLNLMVGNEVRSSQEKEFYFRGTGQEIAVTEFYDWTQGTFNELYSESSFEKKSMLSYFGRAVYKYNEKYIFQGTLRADGASVLAGDKWASFPSASFGWRLNEEDFMNSFTNISNLKLRYSWGIAGTSAIRPYQTITSVSENLIRYSFGDEVYTSNIPYNLGVSDLEWETTTTNDIGLDFGFFNNRIYGSIDGYISQTDHLLSNKPLPLTSVYPQVISNVAGSENRGIELAMSTRNIDKKNFSWTTDLTFSMNKNKITKLYGDESIVYTDNDDGADKIYRIGDAVQSFYYYDYEGIYQVSDLQDEISYLQAQSAAGATIDSSMIPMILNDYLPGDVKLDLGEDGELSDDDKVAFSQSPKFFFSLNNNVNYRGIGLSVKLYGRVGQTIKYEYYESYKSAETIFENGPNVDAWTPENTGALFPRYMDGETSNNTDYTDPITLVDGSYVKVKDITLSYSLPNSILDNIGLSKIRIYATAKNMFTFSNIENYDPEREGSMSFPLPKQFIAGLNIEF